MRNGHAGYRPDIDGLRAIAVTSVVAFHAGVPHVGGGFVGVDVFFVISGFLITQLLLREAMRNERIDLAEFYARRIRRLFPALAVVVLVTMVAGHFLLLPLLEQPALAKSSLWTSFYGSNIYLKHVASDYFAGPVDQQPLLHTWSLAVEEQYYLVWPSIVLAVCWLARRRSLDLRAALLMVLAPLSAVSLWLCIHWTATNQSAAFYLLPSRVWELGAGAILAIVLERVSSPRPALGNALLAAGLAAILAAIFGFDRTTSFPGVAAILPVSGTVACVAAGALGATLSRPLLGNRPSVAIGKVSYSWYLWHWPLLAIARTRSLGEVNLSRDVLLATISLLLAALTLFTVENPIRENRPGPFGRARATIVVGLLISAALAVAAVALNWAAHREARDPRYAELAAAIHDTSPLHARCHTTDRPGPLASCTLPAPDASRLVVVWGDSHAELTVAPVAAFGAAHGIPVAQQTSSACPPLLGAIPSNDDRTPNRGCAAFNRAVLAGVEERAKSGTRVTVVLDARWPNYLASRSPAGIPTRTLFATEGTGGTPRELLARGIDALVSELQAHGIAVVLVAPLPELTSSPPQCRLRTPDRCDVSRAIAEEYRAPALRALQQVAARHPGIALVDAFGALCTARTCSPVLGGKLAYVDPHHLTYSAAAQLLGYFEPQLVRAVGLAPQP